jgi:hypothetical protein
MYIGIDKLMKPSLFIDKTSEYLNVKLKILFFSHVFNNVLAVLKDDEIIYITIPH